jgi:hypothetical protein
MGIGLAAGLAGLIPRPAAAESFGGIVPGETTRGAVEAQYGPPTSLRTVVEEGRAVPEWTYAGRKAPAGLERMVLSFGFILSDGFSADVVRAVTIYPRPRVFTVQAIAGGWGTPDAIGTEEQTGRSVLRYAARGLLIILHPNGNWAEMMVFAPTPPAPKP